VKPAVALGLLLCAADGRAATAYVTDELVLGVYASQNAQGQRLATLHSGAIVDTLAVNGEATQVRLPDGVVGWVKSAYLVTSPPATVRVKQLQDELDRSRATTPELAEAAERSEVERLTRALADAKAASSAAAPAAQAAGARAGGGSGGVKPSPGWWMGSLLAAGAGGFWLGYATLARRIRHRFGGIKIY